MSAVNSLSYPYQQLPDLKIKKNSARRKFNNFVTFCPSIYVIMIDSANLTLTGGKTDVFTAQEE
ncbi:hypothetical protein ACVLD2_001397 [Paenibacillus sp. PvR052]